MSKHFDRTTLQAVGRTGGGISTVSMLCALVAATPAPAQDGSMRYVSVLVNDAATILHSGEYDILPDDVLFEIGRLRERAETDASGNAANTYFAALDRIDVSALRELMADGFVIPRMRSGDRYQSNCASEISRKVDRLKGFEFYEWSRSGIPDIDWSTGKGYHFVVAGGAPLIRLVPWSDALRDVVPGEPLLIEMFDYSGAGFAKYFAFKEDDILYGRGAISKTDTIIGLLEDIAEPDFGLPTLTIQDYSYCLLPPTPADR